jgi:hypothetical protein
MKKSKLTLFYHVVKVINIIRAKKKAVHPYMAYYKRSLDFPKRIFSSTIAAPTVIMPEWVSYSHKN